jgi:hypothetical protein
MAPDMRKLHLSCLLLLSPATDVLPGVLPHSHVQPLAFRCTAGVLPHSPIQPLDLEVNLALKLKRPLLAAGLAAVPATERQHALTLSTVGRLG